MHDRHDPLGALIAEPPAWLLVVGKGGVGKTTIAAAAACAIADDGRRCDALSVDPAHSLGDALAATLPPATLAFAPADAAPPLPALPSLRAAELEPRAVVREWIARHRAALSTLLSEGSLLDAGEVDSLLAGDWPGLDELATLLLLAGREDRAPLVVDTAPTGHALRILDMPALAEGWIGTLEAMNDRRRAIRDAFARRPDDDADRLLAALREDVARVRRRFADPAVTRALVVANDEPVALLETERLREALTERGVHLAGIVVNRVAGGGLAAGEEPVGRWRAAGIPVATRPALADGPRGADALVAFATGDVRAAGAPVPAAPSAGPEGDEASTTAASADARPGRPLAEVAALLAAPDARLHLVLGKGGVGKTTVSSSLALLLAERRPEARVALVSVDPAGSLGDVWEAPVGDEAAPAPGTDRVLLRQPDVALLWSRFREEAAAEVARILRTLDERSLAAADGEVVASLLRVAPPGMDELMGVLALIAGTARTDYDFIVVDTAPTGHALRLLDTPERAGAWVHATMRVLLRLRPLVGLGPFSERLVELARELREFEALLHDPTRSHLVVVTRPEPLVSLETARLREALRARGFSSVTVLANEVEGGDDATAGEASVVAPREREGPRGADALRRFASRWRGARHDRGARAEATGG